MSFKEFIISRVFLKQLGIAAVLITIMIFVVLKALQNYTNHGVSYPVPDFSGMTEQEAFEAAKNKNVIVEIADSVYSNEAPPGVVVDQIPNAGFKVKENRVVFLTLNSTMPEQVALPQLTNISFRQALVWAENSGLKIGQITYQPSEFNDLVLKVQIGAKEIYPGELLYKGATIDLIIGRIHGNTEVPLPDLTGLTRDEARNYLMNFMLNMGVILYDASVITQNDSINARVWRQIPSPDMTRNVYTGSSVDIWVSVDSTKFQPVEETDFGF
jgi:eukaryotic-like serine/threonine-protein kinase